MGEWWGKSLKEEVRPNCVGLSARLSSMDASPVDRGRIGGLKQRRVVDSGLEGVRLERVRPAIKDCSVDWVSGDKRRRWSGNVMEERTTRIDSRLEVGEVSSWGPMFPIQAPPVFKMSGERVVGVQVEGGRLCGDQEVEGVNTYSPLFSEVELGSSAETISF